jgi:NADPH-dependent 2,4-dienoyl-CoA reductase/sulfur reductase-like enzyme
MVNSPSAFEPDMTFSDYSKAVKDVVKIPVAVVGKIMTPEEAEQVLENGKADAVVIGRASIADPWWAKKALDNDSEDITPCIMCGRCFEKRCTVQLRNYNYDIVPLELQKSKNPKKIVIVGGGPAGMKAAITASQKGHEVVLFEAASELGGLIKVSEYDEYKRQLKYYKDYLINQLKKSDVKILLNTKATPEIVAAEKPDQLILAMGSLPVTPKIKGVEYAHQIVDIYPHIKEIGKNVVIIGGGLVGSELAASLSLKNHNVTIVEKMADIARDDLSIFRLRDYLEERPNVTLMPETNCMEIKKNSVVVADKDGIEKEIPADIVILCVGFRSNNDNILPYYKITPNVSMIGDLRRPATIRECEEEGFFSVSET